MNTIQSIHEKAVQCAKNLKKSDSEMLEAVILIDENRVFEKMNYPSLHRYCVDALGLTDAQAYTYIGVARKSKTVPELKLAVDAGKIHLSNARTIARVVTEENKTEWLKLAEALPQKALEREVVKLEPKEIPKERIRPLTEDLSEFLLVIDREFEKDLTEIKGILGTTSLPALKAMAKEFLKHQKPKKVLVARRAPAQRNGKRTATPKPIVKAVQQRDQRQCTAILPTGKRCPEKRFLHLHHKKPVSHGGFHDPSNLATLCSGHHRLSHASTNKFSPKTRAR